MLLVNHDTHENGAAAPGRPDRPAGGAAGRAGPVPRGSGAAGFGAGRRRARLDRRLPPTHGSDQPTYDGEDRGMSVFRKRRGQNDERRDTDETPTSTRRRRGRRARRGRRRRRRTTTAPAPRPRAPRARGTSARSTDPAAGGRVDLGGLWLPGRQGLEVRIEADQNTGDVVAVTAGARRGRAAGAAVRRAAQRGHLGGRPGRDPVGHHQAGRHRRRGRGPARHRAAHQGAGPRRRTAARPSSRPGSSASTGRGGSCAA